MDHAKAYAHHIAAAIRHKKQMASAPKEEEEDPLLLDDTADGLDDLEPEVPVDPKEARKERLKAILAR
jgi:hypothetical protein